MKLWSPSDPPGLATQYARARLKYAETRLAYWLRREQVAIAQRAKWAQRIDQYRNRLGRDAEEPVSG